jgi:hypothetical protein
MNARLSKGNVVCTCKRILGFAGLATLALACVGVARAQSQLAQPGSAASRPVAAASGSKHGAAENPSGERHAPKGQPEGINVHGHWTIEVRNPDGKLVTHREFENALSPGFPVPTAGQAASGEALLSAMLTGQVASPIAWGIFLEGPNGLASTTNAPCTVAALQIAPGGCLIFQNNTNSSYASFACGATQPAGISCNLAVTPVGTSPNFTGFELQGSVIATQSGSLNFVATADFGVCGSSPAIANCALATGGSNIAAFTGRPLDGNTTAGAAAGDPNPVPVSAGQTVAVTVVISFQ